MLVGDRYTPSRSNCSTALDKLFTAGTPSGMTDVLSLVIAARNFSRAAIVVVAPDGRRTTSR